MLAILAGNIACMGSAWAATIKNKTDYLSGITVGGTYQFGHYWQSYKGSGGYGIQDNYNKDAITWKVLANDNGVITLLSEKVLYADGFDGGSKVWATSQIKATLNERITGNGFAGDAFTATEWAMIKEKTYNVTDENGNVKEENVVSKIYLLDESDIKNGGTYSEIFNSDGSRQTEATYFAANVKVYGNVDVVYVPSEGYPGKVSWWVRSQAADGLPGYTPSGRICNSAGYVQGANGVNQGNKGVRPALDLDFSNLIFVTAAEEGKSTAVAGESIKFKDLDCYTGDLDLWKDDTANTTRVTGDVSVGDTLELNGGKIKIGYKDAKGAGSGEYVSALFFDESGYTYNSSASALSTGNLVGYGKGNAEVSSANGTTEIDMSNLDAGIYKTEIFNENGMFIGKRAEIKGVFVLDSSDKLTYTVDAKDVVFDVSVGLDDGVVLTGSGTDNILENKISGVGNLSFNGDVTSDVDNIKTTGANIVKSNKLLTLSGNGAGNDVLTVEVGGAGNIAIGGTVKSVVNNFANTGNLTVNTDSTLELTEGILTREVTNNGTVSIIDVTFGVGGKITGGNVILGENIEFVKDNLDGIETLTANNAKYNFVLNIGADASVDQITVSNKATGNLQLGRVTISGTNNDAWIVDTSKETKYIIGGSENDIQITNSVTATSDLYKYTISQGITGAGYVKILKENGYTLKVVP